MRILYMGTPDFAVPTLEALIEKYDVVCVVSQPDKPKGRGHNLMPTATKTVALAHGIPVEQPTILKDGAFQPILERYQPDIIVVAAYGRILPDYILEYPKLGCINVHGSILPKYRGAAPIQRAVLNGDAETGVTIMHMAHDMDAGDIIHVETTEILPYETSGQLFDRLSKLGATALMNIIDKIADGSAPRIPQNEAEVTFAPMLKKSEATLDFSMPMEKIVRSVCGLNPWPIANIVLNEVPTKIFEAHRGASTELPAGTVCSIIREGLEVACGDGNSVILKQLQKPGKKPVDGYSFAQGMRLKVGDVL